MSTVCINEKKFFFLFFFSLSLKSSVLTYMIVIKITQFIESSWIILFYLEQEKTNLRSLNPLTVAI